MKIMNYAMPGLSSVVIVLIMLANIALAQEATVHRVALGDAREVVAEIHSTFGTIHLKRGRSTDLLVISQRNGKSGNEASDIDVDYYEENDIGNLTVNLGRGSENEKHSMEAFLGGTVSHTWYITVSDRVPVRFDITLGAGSASIDLTDIHVREFRLDAGAGSIRIKVDTPNREEIHTVALSAGIGKLRTRRLGNLRFQSLNFEGGLGEYLLDCSGELPNNARINTDLGVGSLVIVLPHGIGAKAYTDHNWLSSTNMNGFVKQDGSLYLSEHYEQSRRRIQLDMQSGVGSVAVRWAK